MVYICLGSLPNSSFERKIMLKAIFAAIITKASVHSKAAAIRGNYSNGSVDRPGVWYK
jgi:hypothetical protein